MPDSPQPVRVLYVCTGNLCRSPVAERLTRAWTSPALVTASSAGVTARSGVPMAWQSATALHELGGDAAGFTSRRLEAATLDGVDLVLTMTRSQLDLVLARFPRYVRRSYRLSEAASLAGRLAPEDLVPGADVARLLAQARSRRASRPTDDLDVPDPMGAALEAHRSSAALVSAHVQAVLPLLTRTR